MRHYCKCLLALSLTALLAPAPLFAEEGSASLSGSVEIGAAGTAVDDDTSRVNEYSTGRTEDGVTGYGKFDVDIHDSRGVVLEGSAKIDNLQSDTRDAEYDARLDANRFLRVEIGYGTFEHQLDHDLLNYLDAAVARPGAAEPGTPSNPWPGTLTPDAVPGFMEVSVDPVTGEQTVVSPLSAKTGAEAVTLLSDPNNRVLQTGGAGLYGEDLAPDAEFKIQHRELKSKVEVPVPGVPGLSLDVGYRHEEREGLEQAIGIDKCSACHITGEAKEVDEVTQDVTAGATGKFGLLTLRYAFTDRQFTNRAADPRQIFDPTIKPGQPYGNGAFTNRLNIDYEDGNVPYDTTPDSEKQSHVVKARVDLPSQSTVVGSFVNTEIKSGKMNEPGVFTLDRSQLKTTYDIYGLRATTRIGKRLRLSLRGKIEELENDNVTITIFPLSTVNNAGLTWPSGNPGSFDVSRESTLTRDVTTLGIDAVYRLARKSTLRLGYEYKEIDREDEHFGETETNTVKAALSMRPGKTLSTRLSYKYVDSKDPFHNPHAADVDLTSNPQWFVSGASDAYGTTFYSAREADLSNVPETVHEGKFSATWAPSARFSATVNYRYKDEENELNRYAWEQTTHAPGLSFWYAPSSKVNLSFAYNYLDQRSETAFCQGFYDG